MNNSELKERMKRRGYRVTKDVNGKRVSLTRNEMLNKLGNIKKNNKTPLNKEAHRVRKFIKVCKLILMNINNVRTSRRNNRNNSKKSMKNNNKKNNNRNRSNKNKRVVPPPPPPPPRARAPPPRSPVPPPPPRLPPVTQNPRQALMANLKANLKRRGLSN
jgi:hypothetical protein